MASKGSYLSNNEFLNIDDYLVSPNGWYAAYLQRDANLVLVYAAAGSPDLSKPYWSCEANAGGNYIGNGERLGGPYTALMQADGNFVLYNGTYPSALGAPYWATNTNRATAVFTAAMQDDGNLVIYTGPPAAAGNPADAIWATGTAIGAPVPGGQATPGQVPPVTGAPHQPPITASDDSLGAPPSAQP